MLEGSASYVSWSFHMEALIDLLKIRVVVVKRVIPYPDLTEAELNVFLQMQRDGILLLNQTVKERLLESIPCKDPHLI